jgi:hypothetical protein
MTCELGKQQLAMLKYLVEHRCLRPDRAKRFEAIERDFTGKGVDVKSVLDSLLGSYVAKTPKQSKQHYYVDPSPTLRALKAHGLWSPGRTHHID